MEKKYVLAIGHTWGGEAMYAFNHEGRQFFTMKPFHSEEHAKREAVEYLACIGINVETSDIDVSDFGCCS